MYTYIDSNGNEQTVDYMGRDPFGSIYVTNITSVTWELIGGARDNLLHRVSGEPSDVIREEMKPDVEIVEPAIFINMTLKPGEILGSHSFGATGQVSEQTSRRFEALMRAQVDTLEKRHGRKLAVHRSSESKQLHTLHHRIDPSTGRLIEHPLVPGRTNVE